jgi:hypothetical protein
MSYSPSGGGGSSAIGSASDVALSGPLTGQYFGYNATVQKWQNFSRPPQLIENVFTNPAAGANETISDVTSYTITVLTLTADCTLTFPTVASGKSFMLVLNQDSTGGRGVAWPVSVKWAGGTAPTLTPTASKTDVFSFICVDGANWYGFVAGKSF